jgi:hypothetical protein
VGWNQRSDVSSGGIQDVDYVNAAPEGYIPVENITFPDVKRMPEGKYICKIHNWSFRGTGGKGRAEIAFGNEIFQYEYPATKHHQWITIAEVTLKNGQFSIDHKLETTTGSSKKVWGIDTNNFQKVASIMKSPNHWDGQKVGNEHTFFILEGAKNDEEVRGFFNEFLKEDLLKNKRVFEVLGGKMKVAPAEKQLSGVGFSSTSKNDVYCRVEGNVSRVIKIKF